MSNNIDISKAMMKAADRIRAYYRDHAMRAVVLTSITDNYPQMEIAVISKSVKVLNYIMKVSFYLRTWRVATITPLFDSGLYELSDINTILKEIQDEYKATQDD